MARAVADTLFGLAPESIEQESAWPRPAGSRLLLPHPRRYCPLPLQVGAKVPTAPGPVKSNGVRSEPAEFRRRPGMSTEARLSRVVLDGDLPSRLPAFIEADRDQAIADLAAVTHFTPLTLKPGQVALTCYSLHLSIRDGRLIFDIRDGEEMPITAVGLALGPFRRLMKDYQLLVDSHIKAVEEGREARIQAIDMGRRGLHNEGANLMMRRLQGKIAIDIETARRLFTLVCILHQRVSAR